MQICTDMQNHPDHWWEPQRVVATLHRKTQMLNQCNNVIKHKTKYRTKSVIIFVSNNKIMSFSRVIGSGIYK
jgi:hypothetical protein